MRLHALALHNFRQHVNTRLTFAGGLTGIIGANGAGKTTILEAIAWALYGNSATRGNRDSLRHSRAEPSATVRVDLDFELAGHRYRVERTLRTADVYLDGGAEPIARTIRGANELLQRRLGMSRAEFFNTYFTGQKELDVMAAVGPVERARFRARVLGYDRLGVAQEMLREQRRTLVAELTGLRSGMPDPERVKERELVAERSLATARDRRELVQAVRETAVARVAELEPKWTAADAARERWRQLDGDLRVLDEETQAHAREAARLRAELDEIAGARESLRPLLAEAEELPAQRTALDAMDALASAEGERRALAERLQALRDEEARFVERLDKLETAPRFEEEQRQSLETLRLRFETADRAHDDARTVWARDRQEAETRLEALRVQHEDLTTQQTALEGLGEDSPCPTCGRPLGASFREVLALVTEQLDTVRVDGNYFRQRARQLAQRPESVVTLEEQRAALQLEITNAERRYSRIQAALQEREQLAPARDALRERILAATAQLAALPVGYDLPQHQALRADVSRRQEVVNRASRLQAMVERESGLATAGRAADESVSACEQRRAALRAERDGLAFQPARWETLRDERLQATRAAQAAEVSATEASGEVLRAEQERTAARSARTDLEALQQRASALEAERSLHDELDQAYGTLREALNAQLRPELSELASTLLESLTDGRYSALELDDNYGVQVLEDGVPKGVLSGGEEDLCNLVLRLSISQMIAERAGQPFSLLVLDEVFGSLDDARRDNVLALLRRLHDRFEQVIVITHIEDVREGLDRVLSVTYDPETGTSRVEASAGGAAGAEAAVWESELSAVPGGMAPIGNEDEP